ncbi:unnamed protein product [Arabis nemorensis]|uniref:Uncharacterized protein n=1 Tax=Arabis nemorensis TaxID=586526 RepID=A0A565B408_9BRAS|nr:unnamed protein product [Arabis nemorensis]
MYLEEEGDRFYLAEIFLQSLVSPVGGVELTRAENIGQTAVMASVLAGNVEINYP